MNEKYFISFKDVLNLYCEEDRTVEETIEKQANFYKIYGSVEIDYVNFGYVVYNKSHI